MFFEKATKIWKKNDILLVLQIWAILSLMLSLWVNSHPFVSIGIILCHFMSSCIWYMKWQNNVLTFFSSLRVDNIWDLEGNLNVNYFQKVHFLAILSNILTDFPAPRDNFFDTREAFWKLLTYFKRIIWPAAYNSAQILFSPCQRCISALARLDR